jgi:hypothetical protein
LLSLSTISKVYYKISVSLGLIQNFKISDLATAKVEKINIAVTYKKLTLSANYSLLMPTAALEFKPMTLEL